MKFSGIQKTSLIDFPDRIATVLFTPDCNLRCPFCHNWRIVLDPKPPFLRERTLFKILEGRRKYVDAVVLTGGEPTMHKELPRFLRNLKGKGFAVKLDTNGFFPRILEECMPHVDYVALDVKTSLEKYRLLGATDTSSLLHTVEVLKNGEAEYEFRTTVVPGFVDKDDVQEIGEIVKGGRRLVFQQFVPGDTLDGTLSSIKPYTADVIESFADVMNQYVDEVLLRI